MCDVKGDLFVSSVVKWQNLWLYCVYFVVNIASFSRIILGDIIQFTDSGSLEAPHGYTIELVVEATSPFYL